MHMGMERTIEFENGTVPSWEMIRGRLAGRGIDAALRMIDGLPALPGEEPPAEWRELRLGLPAGVVTLRRDGGRLACVVWGSADEGLRAAWEEVARACAEAGGGTVQGGRRGA